MDTRDGAHDFEVEVSENESRKDFTRTEREAIYTRRVKARMANEPNLAKIPAEIEVASEMGTSRTNLQTERKIIENKDLLPPEDFANWDEGRLSTNKAYQAIKAALAEKEERIATIYTGSRWFFLGRLSPEPKKTLTVCKQLEYNNSIQC